MYQVYAIKTAYGASAVVHIVNASKYITEVSEDHDTGCSAFAYEFSSLEEAVKKANEYVYKQLFE